MLKHKKVVFCWILAFLFTLSLPLSGFAYAPEEPAANEESPVAASAVNVPDPEINLMLEQYRASASALPGSHPASPVEFAFDGDFSTRWNSGGGNAPDGTIEVVFNNIYAFNEITLMEYWNRITAFELQYLVPGTETQWETFYNGTTLGHQKQTTINDFETIEASGLRIHMVRARADQAISLYEFQARLLPGDEPEPEPEPEPALRFDLPQKHIVASGNTHNMAIRDGEVWSWGKNDWGQLGHSGIIERRTAHKVEGLDHVVSVAASLYNSYALKEDGTVWAWGSNELGALGNGESARIAQTSPIQVDGLTNIVAISSSIYQGMALDADGALWAWGLNDFGQLGDGTQINRPRPVKIMEGVKDVVALRTSGIALKEDGTVWTWGKNAYGQLGNSTTEKRLTPAPVDLPRGNYYITAQPESVIVLRDTGEVYGWGRNDFGQLGNGANETIFSPTLIDGIPQIKAAMGGCAFHSFGIGLDNELYIWGLNSHGELGIGNKVNQSRPVKNTALTDVLDASAGNYSSLVAKSDGTFWAFGWNENSQLGNNSKVDSTVPVQVIFEEEPMLDFELPQKHIVSSGYRHNLAIRDGEVWSWGINTWGQLGNNGKTDSKTAHKVEGLNNVVSVVASLDNSYALKEDGTVWAWGNSANGALGNGVSVASARSTPLQISGLSNIVAISSKSQHCLALDSDGVLWAWGKNNDCQVGDGNQSSRLKPVKIMTEVKDIAAMQSASMALKENGTIWTWGNNANGQLADATYKNRVVPAYTVVPAGRYYLAAGSESVMVLDDTGEIYVWGRNNLGQLGNGNNTEIAMSTLLTNTPDFKMLIGSRGSHTLGIDAENRLYAWGYNSNGQLGIGNKIAQSKPVKVDGLTDVIEADGGYSHSLAAKSDGTFWTFGSNANGQLGNNSTTDSFVPVQVVFEETPVQ